MRQNNNDAAPAVTWDKTTDAAPAVTWDKTTDAAPAVTWDKTTDAAPAVTWDKVRKYTYFDGSRTLGCYTVWSGK